MKKRTVTEFINSDWKEFFDHVSKAKNAILPYEGLLECERKILYAAKLLPNFDTDHMTLTRRLGGETGLWHVSGEQSVYDTIKSMGSSYKRQHEVMLLKGYGAFPTSLSNQGAAARYTHVFMTHLSMAIAEDADFCPYFIDDSGLEQPKYLVPPMPLAAIRTMKNIGIGKSCFINERPHDKVFEWSKAIIDKAFPDKSGSGYAKKFYNKIKDTNYISVEDIRNFNPDINHKKISNSQMDEIYAIKAPDPFIHTGCNVTYDDKNKIVWMEAKIETVKEGKKTKYIITDLPLEISDRNVMAKIKAKYGNAIMEKVIDRSGDGHPIYLEIPKSIYMDKENYAAIGLKKALKEQYVMWDEELNAPRIYNNLHVIILEWYKKREEVLGRKLYHKIAKNSRKIYQNNLIKRYYDDIIANGGQKMKEEADVIAKYGQEDGAYLYNLPQKTYLPKNIELLENKNKELQKSIDETENTINNIKEYIFETWRKIADANNKLFKGFL